MNELVINFSDLNQTLEPIFGGKSIKVILEESKAIIFSEEEEAEEDEGTFKYAFDTEEERIAMAHRLCGIFSERADPELRKIEREAYINGIVEKYTQNLNT
jgi:hypothetical protein